MSIFQQIVQFLLNLFRSKPAAAVKKSDNQPVPPEPEIKKEPSVGPAATKLPDETPTPPPEKPSPAVEEPLSPLPVKISEVQRSGKTYITATDGKVEIEFRPHKKGLYTVGRQRAADFIRDHRSSLDPMDLSESAINVMLPVSENEGNLDAINTWDNSFLTFGMFQWTIGAQENAGELPALLKKIKEKDPESFHRYFGIYGLDITGETGAVYGFLTLDGTPVKARSLKEQFRHPEWAFRFWKAGQHPTVKAVEIEHAISRLKTFYWKSKFSVEGHPIADIITSEYGVALILDNHVNRPGYVDNCLRLAVKQSNLHSPESWTTADEMRVIDAYLSIRKDYGKYPMTHADKRADVTRRYVEQGILSTDRGSFIYTPGAASRGGSPADLIGIPPYDYREENYDDILHYDRQVDEMGLEPVEEQME